MPRIDLRKSCTGSFASSLDRSIPVVEKNGNRWLLDLAKLEHCWTDGAEDKADVLYSCDEKTWVVQTDPKSILVENRLEDGVAVSHYRQSDGRQLTPVEAAQWLVTRGYALPAELTEFRQDLFATSLVPPTTKNTDEELSSDTITGRHAQVTEKGGLAALETETPHISLEDGQWVMGKEAAKIEGLETGTLKSYRHRGAMNSEKNFGRDRDGRIWRRVGTPRSHPRYFRRTLRVVSENR